MATMEIDDKAWYNAWLDTPLGMHRRGVIESDAMTIPGCCVKSREREGMWPKHHGKLVSYTDDLGGRIVVRGHDSAVSPRFVWIGTKEEYYRTWICD
jgi:hypothetical protein